MKRLIILIIIGFTIICQNAYADDNNIIAFKKNKEEHRTPSSAVGISINSKYEIALGFKDRYINVYDSNGKFINGYSFNFYGSYVFKYDEMDNIMIFPIRSSACYFFNTDAKLVITREITDEVEEDRYYRALEGNKKVSINGNLYELRESLGYTKLLKTDANGNITIIYDMGWDYYTGNILKEVGFLIFIIICLFTLKKTFRKIQKEYNDK